MSNPPPGKSMATGSSVPGTATSTSSHAAGKQREMEQFTIARFLEESTAMLDKIKHTASNVTTCQCQIDQVFDRAGSLLEALSVDSKGLEKSKLQNAGTATEETLKDLHKHVLRFAIYGRPKAFVTRAEISTYFETFNVQMDSVLRQFAIEKHPDVENWEGEYYQAKLDDEAAANDQLWDILNNQSDLKTIMEMGEDAMRVLKSSCTAAIEDPHTTQTRKEMLENAMNNLELHPIGDPSLMNPMTLMKKLKTPATDRLTAGSLNRASSSTSHTGRTTPASGAGNAPPAFDPAETPAARAKREEAERERAMASGEGYEEPALPLWEPRRPPPGRGPGSIDGTTEVARNLGALAVSEEHATGQPPPPPPPAGWAGDVPEDLPPSYS